MLQLLLLVALLGAEVQAGVASSASTSPSTAPAREAAAILADFDHLRAPAYDEAARKADPGDLDQLNAARKEIDLRKAKLAKELYDAHPSHPRAAELMVWRWSCLIQYESDWKTTAVESGEFLRAHPDSPRRADALHHRAAALARVGTFEDALAVAEEFIRLQPNDHERGGYLLEVLAEQTTDKTRWRELQQKIIGQFRGTRTAARAAGRLQRLDGLGKPFVLEFRDVQTGRRVTTAGLKGKVVVVDFWATWCRPCVAELPRLKELYARYKDRGVEFIGISLDAPEADGGLAKLKAFVAKEQIPWPQYYQGNGWLSEFSSRWGIDSIPTLFVIDADGNLHSTDSRERLHEVIQELLKRRDAERAKSAPSRIGKENAKEGASWFERVPSERGAS